MGGYYTHNDNVWCYIEIIIQNYVSERLGQIETGSSCPKKKREKENKILEL